MQMRFLILGIAVAVLVIGGLLWWQNHAPGPSPASPAAPLQPSEPEPLPQAAPEIVEPSTPVAAPAPPPETPLPGLDSSDPFVREQLQMAAPALAPWLERDDLIRRFAVVMENANQGDLPRRQLGFLAPPAGFPVLSRDDQVFLDPAGYARYDGFTELATSVDPGFAAGLLRDIAPLLFDALQELGLRGPDPQTLLLAGIDQALATPMLPEEVELIQPSVLYEFSDPALEALPPLQKQLLRMGPANLERIQAYLREVRGQLMTP